LSRWEGSLRTVVSDSTELPCVIRPRSDGGGEGA
jgi:hypothetical protein